MLAYHLNFCYLFVSINICQCFELGEIMSKKEQKALLVLTKDEMNLAEFPFALLTQRQSGKKATIRFSRYIKDKISGKPVVQEWIVTGAEEYGLPIAIDYDVYLALMKLWKDQNFEGDHIYFTRYQLLKLLQWSKSKREYDRLEHSLDRLKTVSIKARRAFWDNKAKKYVTRNVNLFTEYHLYEEKCGKKNETDRPLSYIIVSPALIESVRNGFIRSLDIEKYLAMRSAVTKRLYRFLSKMRYNHYPQFKISLQELADLLPIRDKRPSHIKRILERAHGRLRDDHFLADVSYRQENKDMKIIYTFCPNETSVRTKLASGDAPVEQYTTDESELIEAFVKRRITAKVAADLVENFPKDYLQEKIAVFDWMLQSEHKNLRQNPQGFLRRSIEDHYQIPSDYQRYLDLQKKRTEPPREETPKVPPPKDEFLELFESFSSAKQERILKKAIENLNDFMENQYKKHGMESLAVKAAVEENIRKLLELDTQLDLI